MDKTPNPEMNSLYYSQKIGYNFIEYQEYYFIKETIIYKIIIENDGNEILIKSKNYIITFNLEELALLTKEKFGTINDAYQFLILIFEKNNAEIRNIMDKSMILLLKKNEYDEKGFNITLEFNPENKDFIFNEIMKLKKEITRMKNKNDYLIHNEIEKLKSDISDLKVQNMNLKKEIDILKEQKDNRIKFGADKTQNPIEVLNDNNMLKSVNISDLSTLKKISEGIGLSEQKENIFSPGYNCYKKGEKFILKVESPGNSNISVTINYEGDFSNILLKGEKRKDKEPIKEEDNIFNTRKKGKYEINIPIKFEDYIIKKEDPNIIEKKGVFILEFKLEPKKETFGYDPIDEDEL